MLLSKVYLTFGQVDYRVIGLINQVTDSISADFYIESVLDERAFQSNLGIVNRGPRKNIKRPLVMESGFLASMKKQMNSWLKPGKDAEPVVAVLKELYFWESRGGEGTMGFVSLKMGFREKTSGEETDIGVELSGRELTVAKGHAPRLENALFNCLRQYSGQRKDPGLESGGEGPGAEMIKPRKGGLMAASNFLGLWKGNFFPASGNLRRKGGPFRYQLNRMEKHGAAPYFSLVKDNRLFIWARNYPGGGNYYTRVLEQGRYLFLIDDVFLVTNSEEQPEQGQFSGKVAIIIDMETGVPEVVDDKVMDSLMAPYPQLRENYLFKDILDFPFQLTRVQNVIAEINRQAEGD